MTASSPVLSCAETEFLSGDAVIMIVPNFNLQPIQLLNGMIGPFRTEFQVPVPLWVALHLRRSRKCHIVPPDWLSLSFINDRIEQEKVDRDGFSQLPSHYIEMAALLFKHAPEDIPNVTKVKSALNALESIRFVKLRSGLSEISSAFSFAKLNNVTLMEINQIRSYTTNALDQFYSLSMEASNLEDPSQTQEVFL